MRSKKPKLHPKWKKLHKTYSVIAMVLGLLLTLVELGLPYFGIISPLLTQGQYVVAAISISLFGIIGRYIKQSFGEDND